MQLSALHVQEQHIDLVVAEAFPRALATMVYGSFARRDIRGDSDVDVLVLVPRPRKTMTRGVMSLAPYSPEGLTRMARRGSLFVLHLLREGRILHDDSGSLRTALEAYRAPADYSALRNELAVLANILAADEAQFRVNAAGYLRFAKYLARSCVYLRCAELGTPLFSLERASEFLQDTQLTRVLRSQDPSFQTFVGLRNVVSDILGCAGENPFGSLEALGVSWAHRHPTASHFAARILVGDADLDYGAFPMLDTL